MSIRIIRRAPLSPTRPTEAAGLAGALFTAYLVTLCPTVHWLDGGELTAAAFHLSSAHPPGEPVFILLGKLFALLPIGTVAFRLNLLSALAGALGCWLTWRIAARLLLEPAPASRAQRDAGATESGAEAGAPARAARLPLAVLAAVVPFLTYPVWLQGVRAEVYSLQLLLALATVTAMMEAGALEGRLEPRWTMAAGLLLGLDLAVHPLLGVLVALPLVVLALARRGAFQPRLWAATVATFLLGFSSYLLLPIRALSHPGHGWGRPERLEAFVDLLLARDFQRNFSPLTRDLLGHNLEVIVGSLLTAASGPVLVLAGLGVAASLARGRIRLALLLAGLVGLNFWSILPQNKVFSENPDFHGYLAVTHVVVWLSAAIALASLADLARGRIRVGEALAFLALASLAAPAVALSIAGADRSGDTLAREQGLAALEGLPAGGFLQTSGNDTMFVLSYLQEVERRRPDVQVLSRTLLTHPWYRKRLPYEEAWQFAAAGPVGAFASRVAPRAVRVELRREDLSDARHLCPVPAPGWGFYEISNCPLLETSGAAPRLEGLILDPRAYHGPEALLVGANALSYLADYYESVGKRNWATEIQAQLVRLGVRLEPDHD